MSQQYATARAFRMALEDRLKRLAQAEEIDLAYLRRQVAFERFLARLFTSDDPPWLLKGGFALEMRLPGKARATRDLDLTIPAPRSLPGNNREIQIMALRDRLQEASEHSLGDWFATQVGVPAHNLDGAPYGGARFPVKILLDERTFAEFHLDAGLGDALIGAPEWLTGRDLLAFAAIPPSRVAAIPREQQFAEKIHAYTLPRGERINTRVKDLVDLVLLIDLGLPDLHQVSTAIRKTFRHRRTHTLPVQLDPPMEIWREPFADLAASCGLGDLSLDQAFERVIYYWIRLPLISGEAP